MHFRDSSPKLRSGLRIEVLTFYWNHEDSKQSCHMTWGCSHGSVPSILLSPFKYFSIFTPFSGSELLWLPSETLQWIQESGQSISLQQHLAIICVRLVLHLCVELTGQTGARLVVDHLLAFLDCIYFILTTTHVLVSEERLFFQLSSGYSRERKVSIFIFLLCILICHYPVWYSSK